MSFSSSRYDRRLASLHVGVPTESVSSEPGVAPASLKSFVSASGEDGGESGDADCPRCEVSGVRPGALMGICPSIDDVSTGDSVPRSGRLVTVVGVNLCGGDVTEVFPFATC